ncbi:hypothetical protein [Rhodococcus jostii]|uniref:hypothetical protein n=1 Tax=Rhodococcus jostii TaxID=132919 RepID=UPI003630040C
MPRQAAHRLLFANKPLEVVLIQVGGEHLDCDRPVQRRLQAAKQDPEAAPSDLDRVLKPVRSQLRRDRRNEITLGCQRVDLGHRAVSST